VHIAYKGSAPGMNDLIGGQVQLGYDTVAIGLQHIKTGRLRALATTGPKRLAILPDVPSTSEFAPGLEAVNWYGMVVPAGTPREAIARLNREITKVLEMPDIKEKLVSQGIDPAANSPEEFGEFMKSEAAKWARVIRAANIKPDS
jgi:tripartite-type tricarboxylate transporter receptor subunit TctC